MEILKKPKYILKIINSYTDNFEGKLALANLEIDKGNIDKANNLLQNLLLMPSIPPEIVLRIKIDLGKILMAKGEYSKAIDEYLSMGALAIQISHTILHFVIYFCKNMSLGGITMKKE
jgi:lipopolysaccharide biosynthesis regulator YciM